MVTRQVVEPDPARELNAQIVIDVRAILIGPDRTVRVHEKHVVTIICE